jgi:hypothetical protein
VQLACKQLNVSERRACRVLRQPRSTQRHILKPSEDEEALTERIIQLATKYGRYGYRRITALLWHEGCQSISGVTMGQSSLPRQSGTG